MNSSLGADASQRAVLDYAVPLAEADTSAALSNQQRMAENARHAATILVERYGIDSANARNEAALEVQRYGIDEATARHAVDAAFEEKRLGAQVGMHAEELQATRDNLQTQIQANREEQERAITAQDRDQGLNAWRADASNLQSQLQSNEQQPAESASGAGAEPPVSDPGQPIGAAIVQSRPAIATGPIGWRSKEHSSSRI